MNPFRVPIGCENPAVVQEVNISIIRGKPSVTEYEFHKIHKTNWTCRSDMHASVTFEEMGGLKKLILLSEIFQTGVIEM